MKKVLIVLAISLVVLGSLAWLYRVELILAMAKKRANQTPIAENREIVWPRGPEVALDGDRPPNIIYILADDLGYNDISTFGGGVADGQVKTPSIDQMAADGVVFAQSYAGNATCAPSRAMILTGRYPTRTGFEFTPTPEGMQPIVSFVMDALDNGLPSSRLNVNADEHTLPYEEQGLPTEEVTIAELLKEEGYYTAHIGKWHLGRSPGFAPNDQGFDDSLLMASGLYLPEDDPGVVNAKLDFDPIDLFLWSGMRYAASFNNATSDDMFEPGGYLTDYWTDEAIKVIKANKNRPFFLYLAHWGPHTPIQATREDYEAVGDIKPHRLRVYAAMIRAVDRSVGRINEVLEEEGLADNTVVMFSSDNGGAGYIGLPEVNAPFRGWKLTNFEGGLRVPNFVKWPGKIAPGVQINEPVAHIDVLPTIAAAAGAELPEGVEIDGVNLLPVAMGEQETLGRDTLFWQSGPYRVVRYQNWKLQLTPAGDAYLFNLAVDPTEQNNLVEDEPERLSELQALLAAHKAAARPPLYSHRTEMTVMVDKSLAEQYEEGDDFIHWPN
ncbi:MAG: sulfatase [Pseudomonadales bacterium]|nr:sulfatase [Pseudomonadales bacterium]